MTSEELAVLSVLTRNLATMLEISHLPEDSELIMPDAVNALRQSRLIFAKYNQEVPSEVDHWLGKVDECRE